MTEPHIGFTVKSGPMTSLGSKGAVFIGNDSPLEEEVKAYRSTSGIGTPANRNPPESRNTLGKGYDLMVKWRRETETPRTDLEEIGPA